MNKQYKIATLFAAAGLVIASLGQGCQGPQSTTTGNPLVAVEFDSYNPNLKAAQEAAGALAVSNLTMCFKRLRFKASLSSTGEDIDLALGEVAISPSGTDLSLVTVPDGTYTRVEFDIDGQCVSGKSLEVTNSHGTFSTTDNFTIRFDGTFTVGTGSASLVLQIQQIVSNLGTVTNSNQIKNKAESASGSF